MTGLLSACDLADLGAIALDALGDTATLARPTVTTDVSGGSGDTYTVLMTVPIQIVQPSGSELQALAGEANERAVQAMGKLPVGTDVRVRDRLTLASNGHRLEVVTVRESPTFSVTLRVLLVAAP